MRLLVTGCTKQQVGGGTKLGYEPVSDLFVKALTGLGHDVHHRRTDPNENLVKQYDAIVVGLVPFFSIASNNLYLAVEAVRQAIIGRVPLLLYVDDWNFPQFVANVKTHLKYGERQLVKPFFKSRHGYDWVTSDPNVSSALLNTMEYLTTHPWPPLLVPTFSWGNHDELRVIPWAQDVEFVDVSTYARHYPFEWGHDGTRAREWVLGTVSNQTEWLEALSLRWDVNHLGTKTSRAPKAVPEAELVQLYADAWGVLSPPYKKILGTGWWRNRFVYAVRAQSILLCDPLEAADLDASYVLYPHDVELMNDAELRDLAHSQADAFFKVQASKVDVMTQLAQALERAREWSKS